LLAKLAGDNHLLKYVAGKEKQRGDLAAKRAAEAEGRLKTLSLFAAKADEPVCGHKRPPRKKRRLYRRQLDPVRAEQTGVHERG
jgi:hypothetical protein